MEIISTNGENKDLILLCGMLDDYLNEAVGGEKQRKEYHQYNKLDDIHDAIVLYEDHIPVACGAFKKYEERTAEIKRVFVRKEYRGRGLAKLLMEQLEIKAKAQGYQRLILETGSILKEAVGLYQGIGYTSIENYGQYKNMPLSLCMSKDI